MQTAKNLLAPPPVLLPSHPEEQETLEAVQAGTTQLTDAAARFPAESFIWAQLAEQAQDRHEFIAAYAYARTGYHRGLDALRANGWKGHGPVPWSHEPNRGFLRCVAALVRAAAAIEESAEATRCTQLLFDCDPAAAELLV
ncbi:MAG TPA: DUF3151 domain-containing protein [Mycobacteriales bacterium]|jgi:hypothetical protein|nr:DUF3151 domain-containing protein [Mycobacteriales bacterium]